MDLVLQGSIQPHNNPSIDPLTEIKLANDLLLDKSIRGEKSTRLKMNLLFCR